LLKLKELYKFLKNSAQENLVVITAAIILCAITLFFIIDFIIDFFSTKLIVILGKIKIKERAKKEKLKNDYQKELKKLKLKKLICYLTKEERNLIVEMFKAAKENIFLSIEDKYWGFDIYSLDNLFHFDVVTNFSKDSICIRGSVIFYIFTKENILEDRSFKISFNNKDLIEILEENNIMTFDYIQSPMDFSGYRAQVEEEYK